MSITPHDLMVFVQGLESAGFSAEVQCRTAISRAYYAAYHDSKDWHGALPAPGRLTGTNYVGVHAELSQRLSSPDASLAADQKTKSKKRAYALRDLHQHRVDADYDLSESIDAELACQAMQIAKTIISVV